MADISKITTLDGQTYDLKDSIARSLKYGVCSTAADTASKEVTIDSVTELTTGLTIYVKFSNTNTVASPTLKVNSLDAKAIKRYGTTAPSTSAASSWNAGAIVGLTYDGTYWVMNDFNNTTYSAATASPQPLGTAAVGTSTDYARADHVHKMPTASDIGAYVKPSGGIPATDLASGVIPDDEVFVAVYNTTSYNDVLAAYNAGKVIICKSGNQYSLLKSYSSNTFNFYTLSSLQGTYRYSVNSNGWDYGSLSVAPPSAATATPSDLGVAAVGTSAKYAREDHVHKLPTASEVGAIAAPSTPAIGQFLSWNGTAWVATSLPVWDGTVV